MKIHTLLPAAALALLGGVSTAQAQAPDTADAAPYRREVFTYPEPAFRDPFASLLKSRDFALRLDDLSLLGAIEGTRTRSSVAVLWDKKEAREIRVKVGDRLGPIHITAIHRHRVDVSIDDLGTFRRASIKLAKDDETKP